MIKSPFDIDAIVRRVLADMAGATVGGGASISQGTLAGQVKNLVPSKPEVKTQPNEKNDRLKLAGSLITLATLEGRLNGVWEIAVPTKTIVTPSVRDMLYKKGVKLVFDDASVAQKIDAAHQTPVPVFGKTIGTNNVWLGLHALKREPETLLQFLQSETTLARESFGCVIKTVNAAVDWLTAQSQNTSTSAAARTMIVTNYSAAAMAVANRVSTLRAVAGMTPEQVTQDAATIGANMLVLHADRLGAYKMKEIARTFLANKIVTCPNDLMAALE